MVVGANEMVPRGIVKSATRSRADSDFSNSASASRTATSRPGLSDSSSMTQRNDRPASAALLVPKGTGNADVGAPTSLKSTRVSEVSARSLFATRNVTWAARNWVD